jgi:2-dehydro-3-deoxygluconokinase
MDVNYRSLLWPPEEARDVLGSLIAAADVVVCSERDARVVFEVGESGAEAARSFAERWAPEAEVVVLTRGAQGSVLVHDHTVSEHAALPATVVDRFGAGDAFVAGLLWALWSEQHPEDAVRAGAALAALKCSIAGDLSRFGAQQLEATLSEAWDGLIRR